MEIPREFQEKTEKLIKESYAKGKVLPVSEAFKKYPAEWTVENGKPKLIGG
jgi:hypothetical protein